MKASEPDDRKWYLAAKLLTDGLSAEEQSEWEAAMGDARFRNDFEVVRKHWHKLDVLPYHAIDKEEGWKALADRIHHYEFRESRSGRLILTRYAAVGALFILAFAVVLFAMRNNTMGELVTTIQAPNGARTFITLPDSSSVWLNAGSNMSYNQGFGKSNRDITLRGEAFFDVRESDVPFSVRASDFHITVLGTAFNVKAYPDDNIITTTLLRGSLRVNRITASGKEEEYLLRPNEKLVLKGSVSERKHSRAVIETNLDARADADWKDGWLTVRGESLAELSKKIERIYNVKVHFEEESLKTYRYNGRIQQLSLEQVLNVLVLTSPLRYHIDGTNVVLSENVDTKSKYESQQP